MFKIGDLVKFKNETFKNPLLSNLPKNKSYRIIHIANQTNLGDPQSVGLDGFPGILFPSNVFRHIVQRNYKVGDIISVRNIPYDIILVQGKFKETSEALYIELLYPFYGYPGYGKIPLKEISILNAQ